MIRVKTGLLWGVTITLGIAALLSAIYGIDMILLGAYPDSGSGSLGHVGIIIAGIVLAFMAIILALFSLYFYSKARRKRQDQTKDKNIQ